MSILTIQNDIATLKGMVNDEASGINALNTQADENTAAIAAINNETTGILITAKNYADDLNEAMDARVKAYEDVKDSYAKKTEVADTYATQQRVNNVESTLTGKIGVNTSAISAINDPDTGIFPFWLRKKRRRI